MRLSVREASSVSEGRMEIATERPPNNKPEHPRDARTVSLREPCYGTPGDLFKS